MKLVLDVLMIGLLSILVLGACFAAGLWLLKRWSRGETP